jgi:hypothetical protein
MGKGGGRRGWTAGVGVVLLLAGTAAGHPGHEPYAQQRQGGQPAQAGDQRGGGGGDRHRADNRVEIVVRDGYRFITSNGIPDHATGRFPNRGNPNAISEQQYRFRVPERPQANDQPTDARGRSFGVAVNGVPFDPGTAEFWNGDRRWNYEALSGEIDLGVDRNLAHVQPTGAYHYHGVPTGLVERLAKASKQKQMLLVGWAADGFPIYAGLGHEAADDAGSPLKKLTSSYRLRKGNRPGGEDGPGGQYDGTFTRDWEYVAGAGDLDECNGRTGMTPEFPEGTYYYVLTDEFPHIPRQWRGTPDESFERKGPGPGGRGGPGGRPGGPGGRGGRGGPTGDRPLPPPHLPPS